MMTVGDMLGVTQGEWLIEPDRTGLATPLHMTMDSREVHTGMVFLAFRGERIDSHTFVAGVAANHATAVVVDRQPDTDTMSTLEEYGCGCLLVPDSLKAYQDLGHACRVRSGANTNFRLIGITGSSGKTSTKEIIRQIADRACPNKVLATEGNTNNLIGVPRNLLRLTDEHQMAVIEMGTNAPGEIAALAQIAQPDIAVLTSIGPVHLEGLGSIEGVATEKAAIFHNLHAHKGWAILPLECAKREQVASCLPSGRTLTVGDTEEANICVDYQQGNLLGSTFDVTLKFNRTDLPFSGYSSSHFQVSWSLTGKHQALNAGLGIAAGLILGLSPEEISTSLARVTLPGMRMKVEKRDGITWINDAYNANASSMKALIDLLASSGIPGDQITLCLGDMLEMGDTGPHWHETVLQQAAECLPDTRILAIGSIMACAGQKTGIGKTFETVAEARGYLHAHLTPYVALKVSRGMRLEALTPA